MTRPKGDDAFLSVRKSALKAVGDYPAEPGEIQLKKKKSCNRLPLAAGTGAGHIGLAGTMLLNRR